MVQRGSVEVTSRAQWRAWLSEHHATSDGIWLVYYKKASQLHVPYEDLVLEALCFGWVDSQAKGVDAERTSITMTPRRPRSRWTQPNRDRVAALEAAALMTDAGRAAVEAAKSNGAWDELRPVEALEVPDDLAAALEGRGLRQRWDAATRTVRWAHLLSLHDAKTAATRSRRLAAVLTALDPP